MQTVVVLGGDGGAGVYRAEVLEPVLGEVVAGEGALEDVGAERG